MEEGRSCRAGNREKGEMKEQRARRRSEERGKEPTDDGWEERRDTDNASAAISVTFGVSLAMECKVVQEV